jgi:hypothetical protein
MPMIPRVTFSVLIAVLPAAGPRFAPLAANDPGASTFSVTFAPADSAAAAVIDTIVNDGARRIESFFGRPFRHGFAVSVYPERDSFNTTLPPEWGKSETPCWVVATGVASELRLLSPRVWGDQACEHDPADREHLRGIVTHELVHVYHGQYAADPEFDGMESLGWFIEGLAVYVSGQLDTGHRERAVEAIRSGAAPDRLEDAWSGPYRYGVAGTIVETVDRLAGREKFRELLDAPDTATLLARIGIPEEELLRRWREEMNRE